MAKQPIHLTLTRIHDAPLPTAHAWLLGDCMESRGRQDLTARRNPELLTNLRESAVIRSVESSNRIEGVTVESARLRPVVLTKTRLRDRSEEELRGYRRALDWVYTNAQKPITPAGIRRLHALAQAGAGDAGKWKARDNDIIELGPDGERRLRFRPLAAAQTPRAMQELCAEYSDERKDRAQQTPALLRISAIVLDFLCIHPFRDGNGRVSRLLTTWLLLNQGFEAPRYVALERLVELEKVEYYAALEECSRGWAQGRNDPRRFTGFFLAILRRGYREFEEQLAAAAAVAPPTIDASGVRIGGKTALIQAAIASRTTPFTLADISADVPAASPALIKRTLSAMRDAGQLTLTGHGRSAVWRYHPNARGPDSSI
jgi:Fic family protein